MREDDDDGDRFKQQFLNIGKLFSLCHHSFFETKRITFFRENTHFIFASVAQSIFPLLLENRARYTILMQNDDDVESILHINKSNLVSFFSHFFFQKWSLQKKSVFLHRTLNVKIGIHLGNFNGRRMCVRTEVLVSEVCSSAICRQP